MIGYVTLGSNDLQRSAAFYDEVLGLMGAKRFMDTDKFIAWTKGPGTPGLSITQPFDGGEATTGNGVMVALSVDTPDQVHAIYEKALELGAKDEGKAGPRDGVPGFYAGYFRDLDGNKLNVFCFTKR